MQHRNTPFFLTAAAVLMLVGAGCAPQTTDGGAISASEAQGESALTAPNPDGMRQRAQEFKDTTGSVAPAPATSDAKTDSYDAHAGEQAPPPTDSSPSTKTMSRTFPGVLPASEIHGKQIRLETTKGTIVFELFDTDAPKTVSNFVALANDHFYDGLTFHRVEPNFVIQGGDPEGTGRGGPGYKFEDEKVTRDYDEGIVAMANAGPNTNGSQFFIMLKDTPLPKLYTIFGKVTSGLDVVHKIAVGDKMTKVTVENKK